MKIVLYSNGLDSHQISIPLELSRHEGVNLIFVSVIDRRSSGVIGRSMFDMEFPFVLRAYESPEAAEAALQLASDADVAVFGELCGQEQYIKARRNSDGLTFRQSERILKHGLGERYFPPRAWRTYDRYLRYQKSGLYALCNSAYLSLDLSLFGFPVERCFKWGYFPSIEAVEEPSPLREDGKLQICSVQRLIWLKRVDLHVELGHLDAIFEILVIAIVVVGGGSSA